jgi:hypothetical protein
MRRVCYLRGGRVYSELEEGKRKLCKQVNETISRSILTIFLTIELADFFASHLRIIYKSVEDAEATWNPLASENGG